MKECQEIFTKGKPIIGMIHLPPLVGYPGYPGIEAIGCRIIQETALLVESGVCAIMVENNYDIPHKEFVNPEVGAVMAILVNVVVKSTRLPVGFDVLWNDYKTALGICAATCASFIRVPAFVDDVRTRYGDMIARASEVIAYRKRLHLEEKVGIFADVQVKHSEMLDKKKTLVTSVRQAVIEGADGIIVTGKWTGDAPILDDLRIAKAHAGSLPVLVGSGSASENLSDLLQLSDGIIVGTAIMDNGVVVREKVFRYMKQYKQIIKYNKEEL